MLITPLEGLKRQRALFYYTLKFSVNYRESLCFMETILNAKVLPGKKLFAVEYDKEKDSLIVKITQVPDKGKANKEIVKELKKLFGTDIEIVFGLKSKEKKIKFNLPKESIITLLETQANSKNQ